MASSEYEAFRIGNGENNQSDHTMSVLNSGVHIGGENRVSTIESQESQSPIKQIHTILESYEQDQSRPVLVTEPNTSAIAPLAVGLLKKSANPSVDNVFKGSVDLPSHALLAAQAAKPELIPIVPYLIETRSRSKFPSLGQINTEDVSKSTLKNKESKVLTSNQSVSMKPA